MYFYVLDIVKNNFINLNLIQDMGVLQLVYLLWQRL